MRNGSNPCKCPAHPFPHREGGGQCTNVMPGIWRKVAARERRDAEQARRAAK